jgi:organic radical activating enzyme
VTTLPVAEVFGPTFQGEGPYTGVRTGFVRLGLCNLSCQWCDTPYTWDSTRYDVDRECPPTELEQVHAQLRAMDVDVVCVSGGEPLMHRAQLDKLLVPPWRWHVETNGTIAPPSWWSEHVEHTSVSPKINTRDPFKKRIKLPALTAWAELGSRVAFKFVASTPADLAEVDYVVELVGIGPSRVWVMPEGSTSSEVIKRHRELAPYVLDRGWNSTTRLHTLLYEQERRH